MCAFTGTLFDVIVLRRLRGSSPLAKLLASLGSPAHHPGDRRAALRDQRAVGTGRALRGPGHLRGRSSDSRFRTTASSWRPWSSVCGAATLWAVYRYTRFGLATRAAVENETKAMLAGLPPDRLSLINTVLSFTVAGALGVLVAPMTQLDPTTITLSVVPALAAALFARFTSFGVVVMLPVSGWERSTPWSPSSRASRGFRKSAGVPIPGSRRVGLFFLIIVAAMYLRGAKLPERGTLTEARLPAAPAA